MGKHRLVSHFMVEGGLNAIDFYGKAFVAEKADAAPGVAGGTSVSLHLDFKKPKQVDEAIEQSLKAGATLNMPAQNTFWGTRCGRARDPFGSYLGFSRAS